ncbi:MAG TPA: Fe-S protein assembly co-chaperone HscB [Saprospiraceae bacterium]|nr:Fe-S protein assembly co-chaperone HscB [Saprospiraceae bacterium]
MDYFEWFGLDRKFNIDQAGLRKAFLTKSMELHPDKTGLNENKAMELSEYNNKAYGILKDSYKTLDYILHLEGIVLADEKYQLPQDFLMEMLELNMDIEDAGESGDKEKLNKIKSDLETKGIEEDAKMEILKNQYDSRSIDPQGYESLKKFYFIRKYLLRIEESINTFASH